MKQKWESYTDELNIFCENISEVLNGLKPGPRTDKLKKAVNTSWERLRRSTEAIGAFLIPIDPEEIELPYLSPQFAEYWKRYKDYLQEEHQVFMRTRRENELLKTLQRWAGDSDKKAIDILSFLIRSGYRAFFRPTDRQLSGDEPATAGEEQQSFGNVNMNKKKQV